jgi:3-deoxy-D-manno-oct-2-ulosonic acid (Kdo) hydroxylase
MMPLASSEIRPTDAGTQLSFRLEAGEIVCFPEPPAQLLPDADREFLMGQRVTGSSARHIVVDPASAMVHHAAGSDAESSTRLVQVFERFSTKATAWMTGLLPSYAPAWQIGSLSLRTEEEATRRLRFGQREDLLHIDPFPEGASRGRRLLRLFLNLNPTEPRVWATSDKLDRLLERFGGDTRFPSLEDRSWGWQLRQGVSRLLDARQRGRSAGDEFLLRLQDYVKANDQFQERGPKRFWHFAPRSAWLVMTDGLSHAVLRGRHALEMSLYVDPATLACPELAPARVVELYGKQQQRRQAA